MTSAERTLPAEGVSPAATHVEPAKGEPAVEPASPAATRWLPESALIAVVLIWSSTWLAMKDALEVITPLAFMTGRFVLIAALAWGVALISHRRSGTSLAVARGDWPLLLLGALTGYTAYQLCAVFALDNSSVFTLSLLIALVPLFTMLIQVARREPLPRYAWPGILIAVAGTVLFLSDKRDSGDTVLGVVLSLGAAVAFAVYGLISRPLARRYPSATLSAHQITLGTLPLLLVGWSSTAEQDWTGLPLRVWVGIVFVVIFPVYVAYQLWNYAIGKRGAARASSYALLVPILSGVGSSFAFDEPLTLLKLAGALLVIAGLSLVRLDRLPWRR
jgi:drug/metabolite transporter (DMT)-like permease